MGRAGGGEGDARQISPLTDALTGIGCLLLTIAFLGIWVYGLVALLD